MSHEPTLQAKAHLLHHPELGTARGDYEASE